MNTIPAGSAAHRNDAVTGNGIAFDRGPRHDTDATAVDQRVTDVPIIEPDPTVDGRNTHSIPIVADPPDHLAQNAMRMNASIGNARRRIRPDTEHIGRGNRFRRKPRTHDVSNAAANSRGSAAVGLDRGRVIVGLDLHADRGVFIEGHDPRVVHEHRKAPVIKPLRHQTMGGGGDGRLEQVVDQNAAIGDEGMPRAIFHRLPNGDRPTLGEIRRFVVFDRRLERLVYAMLGPGLGERLEFDLARLPPQRLIVRLNRQHLIEREKEMGFPTQPFEGRSIEFAERNVANFKRLMMSHRKRSRLIGLGVNRMDDRIRQQPRGELPPSLGIDTAEGVPAASSHHDA